MKKRRPGRERLHEIEPCHRCKTPRGMHCQNYRGKRKFACWLAVICRLCAAQLPECNCRERAVRQGVGTLPSEIEWTGQRLLFGDPVAGVALSGEQKARGG